MGMLFQSADQRAVLIVAALVMLVFHLTAEPLDFRRQAFGSMNMLFQTTDQLTVLIAAALVMDMGNFTADAVLVFDFVHQAETSTPFSS